LVAGLVSAIAGALFAAVRNDRGERGS
jgi:hypothetical protein